MKLTTVVKGGATAAGLALAAAAGYVGVQWTRYGHVDPERHPSDPLVDRFLPDPVVDEYHSLRVTAPAPMTFEAAKKMDLQASPFVKGIFALRAIPTMLKGEPLRLGGSEGIIKDSLAGGWGLLAEEPGREIVIGTYTQPWHENVEFRALEPDAFAGFDEPGFVKIVVSLAAEPLGPQESLFVTRTRVATTDEEARRKFRRYWAPMSSGIILIRYLTLPLVRKAAEREARDAEIRQPAQVGAALHSG